MFTGLIEDVGYVRSWKRRGEAGILEVKTGLPVNEISIGDSVSVNGVCLTVTAIVSGCLTFDVSPESIFRTTMSDIRPGSSVNLERALKAGDRLGGHIVTGHIDCTGRISGMRESSGSRTIEFFLPPTTAHALVEKGSIAVDGISLTVNSVLKDGFSVTIIPHTFENTTLTVRNSGDVVNIETDIIGKYVARLLTPYRQHEGLTLEKLAGNGFL